jgi:SAM-dependent methyltransferase
MREEAISNLENFPGVKIIGNVCDLPPATFDIIFCLEVFEHLPPPETEAAIDNIAQILKPNGYACIGVPNEIYIPALIKGLFRISRRYGAYDANWTNLIAATLGNPPKNRPVNKIQEKLFLHYHHMGFDFRTFKNNINQKFTIEKIWGSPMTNLPAILNFEVYFLCKHKK